MLAKNADGSLFRKAPWAGPPPCDEAYHLATAIPIFLVRVATRAGDLLP